MINISIPSVLCPRAAPPGTHAIHVYSAANEDFARCGCERGGGQLVTHAALGLVAAGAGPHCESCDPSAAGGRACGTAAPSTRR